jgi:2-methylcitrate dehydratase
VQKIKVEGDAELNARYPEGIPNRLTVRTADGNSHVCEVTFPRGHARNPMTDAEVEQKFRSMAEPLLPAATVAEIVDRCMNLERETNIGGILSLFAGAAKEE